MYIPPYFAQYNSVKEICFTLMKESPSLYDGDSFHVCLKTTSMHCIIV